MADEYDYLFKCIVVGDGGVGKTALTIRFSKGFFTEDYKMTIGVDFHVKTIEIDTEEEGPINVKLQIWDTGGQERFSSIRPMYYRGSLGGLLIFDLTSYESFEHLPQWIEEVRANVKAEIPLLLVGNKCDLISERALSIEEINEFTRKFNLYYMETSAKTGDGVGDCFYILACLMVGSGVPDKLTSQGVVYGPGQAASTATISPSSELPSEPISDFIAPPVPEPIKSIEPKPEVEFSAPTIPEPIKPIEAEPKVEFSAPSAPAPPKIIKTEPEVEFSAPPVPEPPRIFESEPEIDFSAPPVPEPTKTFKTEPKIPVPESISSPPKKDIMEFEFKTPDQILSEQAQENEIKKSFKLASKPIVSPEIPDYKPKAVPFTSNIPIPAPAPEEFRTSESISESEPEIESDSLVDYMAETILSKKEKKKIEKQRKKEEKEKKLQEKRKKAAELKKRMQKAGKEQEKKKKAEKPPKKEPETLLFKEQPQPLGTIENGAIPFQTTLPKEETSNVPDLFQTLTQKTDQQTSSRTSPFIPFGANHETDKGESSGLRIIPNVADVVNETPINSSQIPTPSAPAEPLMPSSPPLHSSSQKSHKSDIIICPYCGAMLSSDYAFCNKCGAKL